MRLGINATILDGRPSGLGVYTVNIVRQLAARAGDVVAYTSVDGVPGLDAGGVRNVVTAVRPSLGRYGHLARLVWMQTVFPLRLMRERRSVVFSPCPEGMLLPPMPQVCVVHDLLPLRFREYFPRLQWYFSRVLPSILRRCAVVIVDSESTRRDLASFFGIGDGRVQVVPPSHEAERFHAGLDPAPVARRYGLERYILYVGNLLPHKNVKGLIQAFAQVRGCIPHQLVIVGHQDPRFYPGLSAEIERLGLGERVVSLDYVPDQDLPSLYAGADLYVQPSLFEGFGLTVLEAMACGTPVIAARGGALPEVGADAVCWVEPGDVDGLAAALGRVARDRDLKASLREWGLRRASDFAWVASGERIFRILEGTPGAA
ncbi:MAG: glycosyltransferase family 4 protein [Candidatus Rokubacteria bacterium]|nr:glycosyltransferase family 4 protein [Candidatus Rokubacteria bacterium]